jgi:hypothetical protein
LRTAFNTLDWRYKIPPESKAGVFFMMDDDITINCEDLKQGFKVWQ